MTGNLPVTLRYHFSQFRQTRRAYILLSPALRLLINFEPRQHLAQVFTEGDSPNSNGIPCPYRPGLWCLAIASMCSNFGGDSTPSRSSPSPKLSNVTLSRNVSSQYSASQVEDASSRTPSRGGCPDYRCSWDLDTSPRAILWRESGPDGVVVPGTAWHELLRTLSSHPSRALRAFQ